MKKANNKQTARHGTIRSSILLCPVILATIGGTFYGEAVAVTAQIKIGGVLKIQQEGRIYIGKNGKIEKTGKIINESKDSELKGTLTFSGTTETDQDEADKMPSAIHNHGDMFYYKTGTGDPNLVKDTTTSNTGPHAYHIDYSGFTNDLDNTHKANTPFPNSSAPSSSATVDAYKYTGNDYSSTKLLDSDETRAKAAYFDLVNDKPEGTDPTDQFNIYQKARTYTQIGNGHLTVKVPFSDSAGFSANLENNSLDIPQTGGGKYNFTKISDDEYEGSSGDHKEVIRSYDSFYKGPNIRAVPSWKFVDPDDDTKTIGTVYRVGNIYKFAAGNDGYDKAETLTYDEIDKKYKNSDGTKSFAYEGITIKYTSGTESTIFTGISSGDTIFEYEYMDKAEGKVKTKLFEKTESVNEGDYKNTTYKAAYNDKMILKTTIKGNSFESITYKGQTYEYDSDKKAFINDGKTIRVKDNVLFREHVAGKASNYEGYVSPSKNTAEAAEEAAEAAIQSRLKTAKVIGDGNDVTFMHEDNDLVQNETLSDNAYDIDSATRTLRGYTNTLEYDADNTTTKKEAKGSFYSIYGYEKGYAKADDYLNGATNFLYGRNKQYDSDGNLTGDDGTPVHIPPVDENSVLEVKAKDGTNLTKYEADVLDEYHDSPFKFSEWTTDDPVITYSGDNSYYNGMFKQKSGGVIVPNSAAFFGGEYEMGDISGVDAKDGDGNLYPKYTSVKEYINDLNGPRRYEEADSLLKELQEKNEKGTLTQSDAVDFFYLSGTKFKDFIEDYELHTNILGTAKTNAGIGTEVTNTNELLALDGNSNYVVDARKLLYNIGKSLQQNGSDSGTELAKLTNYDNFDPGGISTLFNTIAVKGKAYKDDLEANEAKAQAYQKEIGRMIADGAWNPMELEWQGGAKDEYNKPTIRAIGASKLYFNLLEKDDAGEYVKRGGIIEEYETGKTYTDSGYVMADTGAVKRYSASKADNGLWVENNGQYVRYDQTNSNHIGVTRYSMQKSEFGDYVRNIQNSNKNFFEAYDSDIDNGTGYSRDYYEKEESTEVQLYTKDANGDYSTYDGDVEDSKTYYVLPETTTANPIPDYEEYNKNTIYRSTGYELNGTNPQKYKSGIFSLYGNLEGDENSVFVAQNGILYVKGDCSDFNGTWGITQNSTVQFRNMDEGSSSFYKSRNPETRMMQIDPSTGEAITVSSLDFNKPTIVDSPNVNYLTLRNGCTTIQNNDETSDGTVKLAGATVDRGAYTKINGDAEITNTVVEGIMEVGSLVAKGVSLQGGALIVRGRVETQNMNVASTIISWGNNNYADVVSISDQGGDGTFEIRDQHTLKFFSDYNVEEKDKDDETLYQSDRINALSATDVRAGGGIEIAGMNIKGTPTEEVYKFMVYSGTAAIGDMPISIGATYNTNAGNEYSLDLQVYNNVQDFTTSKDGIVTSDTENLLETLYTVSNTEDKLATEKLTTVEKLDDVDYSYTIDFGGDNIYYVGALSDQGKAYVYLRSKNGSVAVNPDIAAGIAATSFGIGDTVTDTDVLLDSAAIGDAWIGSKKKPAKYKLWNKTFGEHSTVEMNTDNDSKLNGIGSMLGFDMEAKTLQSKDLQLMPTVFAGIEHKQVKYLSTRYRTDGYFGGIKAALFNTKHALEVFGIYDFFRTKANLTSGSAKIKTHAVSLGTKYEYSLPMKCNWSFRPGVFADYEFLHSPSFKTGENSSTHKMKNRHKFEVAPVVSLNRQCGLWNSRAFVSYHQKFGTKGKSTVNTTTSDIDKAKKYFMEYGLEVSRINAKDTAKFGLKLSRKTLGVKGFKGALTVGVKL